MVAFVDAVRRHGHRHGKAWWPHEVAARATVVRLQRSPRASPVIDGDDPNGLDGNANDIGYEDW